MEEAPEGPQRNGVQRPSSLNTPTPTSDGLGTPQGAATSTSATLRTASGPASTLPRPAGARGPSLSPRARSTPPRCRPRAAAGPGPRP